MKEIVAWAFGLGLLGNAALFVPQAIAVWRKKSDEGVSLITFGGFNVLQAIGIVHGLYQGDRALTIGMIASSNKCTAGAPEIKLPTNSPTPTRIEAQ